jgi:hypothetical protein
MGIKVIILIWRLEFNPWLLKILSHALVRSVLIWNYHLDWNKTDIAQ